MAKVIIQVKVLPKDAEVNLEKIEESIKSIIKKEGEFIKFEKKPVAFGLNELNVFFLMEENKASLLEGIEEKIQNVEGVSSVQTVDVRRTFA